MSPRNLPNKRASGSAVTLARTRPFGTRCCLLLLMCGSLCPVVGHPPTLQVVTSSAVRCRASCIVNNWMCTQGRLRKPKKASIQDWRGGPSPAQAHKRLLKLHESKYGINGSALQHCASHSNSGKSDGRDVRSRAGRTKTTRRTAFLLTAARLVRVLEHKRLPNKERP